MQCFGSFCPASVNPTQFINIVTECRSKHRVTSYCDEAIARAKQLAKHSAGELELYTQTRSHSHTYAGMHSTLHD